MSVLKLVSQIFQSPSGSFVYHLLILLVVEAAMGMAWGEWQRTRHEQARRFLLAMAGLTLARLAYALAALLVVTNGLDPVGLLPPLERLVDAASICLLGWAFLPSGRREARPWEWVFGASLVVTVVVGAVLTATWSSVHAEGTISDYNTYWQATLWSVWQMALIVLAGLAAGRQQREISSTFLVAMFVMFLGRPLQIAYPDLVPNVPAWERMANLVAYPLVAVAVYQSIVIGLRTRAQHLEDLSQASLDQLKSLLLVSEASRQISSTLELRSVLDQTVRGLARALEADQCAVALPANGDPGYMRLAAIYDPTRHGRVETPTFPLEYQLAVQQAMRRKKPVAVEESENVQLRVLFSLMGSNETGPLLVQPLLLDGEAIGAILVGNSRSRRPFTPPETKLCQSMAEHVAGAIQNARRYQSAQDKVKELCRSLDERCYTLQQPKAPVQEPAEGANSSAEAAVPGPALGGLRRTG